MSNDQPLLTSLYTSNVIPGMVQGNIAFKHFHFLTLGDKFYLGLFA